MTRTERAKIEVARSYISELQYHCRYMNPSVPQIARDLHVVARKLDELLDTPAIVE